MKPTIPDHTIEAAERHFVVKVGKDVAGTISQDGEYPGLWAAWDQHGQFMGRVASQEQAAEFLAAWFVAEDEA